ncbi:MAG: hypothetical protein K0V04_38935 [Deltaproteobacteria bacterium]|nr:hypothetical protein [Deltaproteobacteria bacterium]
MASHAVQRLLSSTPSPDDSTRVEVCVELACGCRLTRTIAADRIVERPGGESFAVGKFPCPLDHPVRRPTL